jgi:hypothetical protein
MHPGLVQVYQYMYWDGKRHVQSTNYSTLEVIRRDLGAVPISKTEKTVLRAEVVDGVYIEPQPENN